MRDERTNEAIRPIRQRRIATRSAPLYCFVAILPALASLSDARRFDPSSDYAQAQSWFNHGYVEVAQKEADRGYRQSIASNQAWVRRFQILEASAMVWRGFNLEALKLLSEKVPVSASLSTQPQEQSRDEDIEQYALESTALIYLGRLPEADQRLKAAEVLCAASLSAPCGSALRAHALLDLTERKLDAAKRSYLETVAFARSHQDRMLEGSALMDLGTMMSNQDHHDEALDLYKASYATAMEIGAEDLALAALGGEGWEDYSLGNAEKAVDLYSKAAERAASLGDIDSEAQILTVSALAYASLDWLSLAENSDLRAIKLAKQIHRNDKIINASEDLAQLYIDQKRPNDADRYAWQAESLTPSTNRFDLLYCHLLQGEAAALRHDWPRAENLLHEVAAAPESQTRMRWTAQHTLATMYEAQGKAAAAEQSYKAALALVEGARADLKQELSQLTFLINAARIYDDYIHFLVAQGRGDEALEAADWSRARTLQQGLGLIPASASLKPPPLRASEIARQSNATLLFYWMGERQSYVWAVSPQKTTLVTLPAKSELVTRIGRYRRTLLALKDPLRENNGQADKDGRDLYEMLVAPVAGVIAQGRPVILFTDGEMSQLNFETLLVSSPTPHYWIDDATASSAPSIRMLVAKSASAKLTRGKLLLLGDSLSSDPALPHLPMADVEVHKVEARFKLSDKAVFSGAQATPLTYLRSKPEQFSYIHFVAHGTASTTDPLDSAVILSRDNAGEDSYKLYARDILRHPISARLVTVSACNSSGTKSYAGEGVVGISWAFLRAGAHNTIGALWDVSDASTPELMDRLYNGLQLHKQPAVALREAKLSLLHSSGNFSRPFYWAPFQLYSGH
jgi:CHAT domain-containing protein